MTSFFVMENDDGGGVFVKVDESTVHKVGVYGFDHHRWTFTQLNAEWVQGVTVELEVDPEAEAHLLAMEVESRTKAQGDAVLTAHLAGIATHASLYKNDSRDMAKIAAIIAARKWWRNGYQDS